MVSQRPIGSYRPAQQGKSGVKVLYVLVGLVCLDEAFSFSPESDSVMVDA